MSDHYILKGRKLIPATLLGWAKWFETADRHVGLDVVENFRISTVFLGLDHSFGYGPPLFFETMVFDTKKIWKIGNTIGKGLEVDDYTRRYSTYDEAEQGHHETVNKIRSLVHDAKGQGRKPQAL